MAKLNPGKLPEHKTTPGSPRTETAPDETPPAGPVLIPWSLLDPVFRVLGGTTPVRFEGLGYVRPSGLEIVEVRIGKRT
uniref:Uncharacterized protein n=1 Tax=viral metagenome TaxID=1070528 RepID=A0A6M3IFJ9_9ZZZZ